MAPGGHEADIFDFRIQPRFADAKAFLGHLRGLGAHVPKGGAAPLSPGALRRVMRVFEDSGAAATYHVAVCTFRTLASAVPLAGLFIPASGTDVGQTVVTALLARQWRARGQTPEVRNPVT